MYFFSGGGYGGWWETDGLTNGCSTVGISKTQPVEILEQHYPLLFEEYALREGSAGAGRHRGGFGVNYRVRLLRGSATASFLMDHGRDGPPGLHRRRAGRDQRADRAARTARRRCPSISRRAKATSSTPGDWVQVRTPGGGGYGDPRERDPLLVRRDVERGYITAARGRALVSARQRRRLIGRITGLRGRGS